MPICACDLGFTQKPGTVGLPTCDYTWEDAYSAPFTFLRIFECVMSILCIGFAFYILRIAILERWGKKKTTVIGLMFGPYRILVPVIFIIYLSTSFITWSIDPFSFYGNLPYMFYLLLSDFASPMGSFYILGLILHLLGFLEKTNFVVNREMNLEKIGNAYTTYVGKTSIQDIILDAKQFKIYTYINIGLNGSLYLIQVALSIVHYEQMPAYFVYTKTYSSILAALYFFYTLMLIFIWKGLIGFMNPMVKAKIKPVFVKVAGASLCSSINTACSLAVAYADPTNFWSSFYKYTWASTIMKYAATIFALSSLIEHEFIIVNLSKPAFKEAETSDETFEVKSVSIVI